MVCRRRKSFWSPSFQFQFQWRRNPPINLAWKLRKDGSCRPLLSVLVNFENVTMLCQRWWFNHHDIKEFHVNMSNNVNNDGLMIMIWGSFTTELRHDGQPATTGWSLNGQLSTGCIVNINDCPGTRHSWILPMHFDPTVHEQSACASLRAELKSN